MAAFESAAARTRPRARGGGRADEAHPGGPAAAAARGATWRALAWTVGYAAAFTAVAMHGYPFQIVPALPAAALGGRGVSLPQSAGLCVPGLAPTSRFRASGRDCASSGLPAGDASGIFRGLANDSVRDGGLAWHARDPTPPARHDAPRGCRFSTSRCCAPSAYVTVPALWLVALLSGRRDPRWWPAAMVAGWMLIVGTPPLPDRLDLIIAGLGQAV